MTEWIESHATKLMLVCIALFGIAFSVVHIIDHLALRTAITDLAHMEQALWSLLQGDIWMTISHPYTVSRLVHHANLIFYVLLPLYALFPHPETLLLLSSASVCLGAWLVFLLASHLLKRKTSALLIATTLLLSPPVQELVLFDFHPHVLAIPLLVGAVLSLEKKKLLWFGVCIALLLSVKEDMPLLVAFLSPFIAKRHSWKVGLVTAAAAITYFIGLDLLLEYIFSQQRIRSPLGRFNHLGTTWVDIVRTLIIHPSVIVGSLNEMATTHIAYLFVHGGFVALLSPLVLLAAVPNIAQNILANTPYQAQLVGVYYSGVILTVITVASLYSFVYLQQKSQKWYRWILSIFTLQSLCISVFLSPLPYGALSYISDFEFTFHREDFSHIAKQIPPRAGLATQRSLGPHFAARQCLTEYPDVECADYIFLMPSMVHLYKSPFALHREEMMFGVGVEEFIELTIGVFDNPDFGVVDYRPPFYLLKRGQSDSKNAEAYEAYLNDIVFLRESL